MKKVNKNNIRIGAYVYGRAYFNKDEYTGRVYHIDSEFVTIKRDDGIPGNGHIISEPPYYGTNGWIVILKSSGVFGHQLYILNKKEYIEKVI